MLEAPMSKPASPLAAVLDSPPLDAPRLKGSKFQVDEDAAIPVPEAPTLSHAREFLWSEARKRDASAAFARVMGEDAAADEASDQARCFRVACAHLDRVLGAH